MILRQDSAWNTPTRVCPAACPLNVSGRRLDQVHNFADACGVLGGIDAGFAAQAVGHHAALADDAVPCLRCGQAVKELTPQHAASHGPSVEDMMVAHRETGVSRPVEVHILLNMKNLLGN